MKKIFYFIFLISSVLFAQKTPEDFGYKYLEIEYKNEIIKLIVQSKKGDEAKQKPLFFWCQGSLPQPVIKYSEEGLYGTFPFDANDFLEEFHLIIIGKPGIPIISDVKKLKKNFTFKDDSLRVNKEFSDRNYLNYYVERNNYVLKKLLKESWISTSKLVVAGHSEGSYIATEMAVQNRKITHLINSGGNPYGRYLSILAESRYIEKDNTTFDNWKKIVSNKNNLDYTGGDTYKCTYDFSLPLSEKIKKLKIPILISYGTKDWNAPYNDLLYIESIRINKSNISFSPYLGLEHNYFPVNEKLEINQEIYNWENVGKDWIKWLKTNN